MLQTISISTLNRRIDGDSPTDSISGVMRPLLLHFEESTSEKSAEPKKITHLSKEPLTEIQRIVAGTKTLSEIRAEADDADPHIQIQLIAAGTSTCTRVRAEANDADPHARNRNGLAIPV